MSRIVKKIKLPQNRKTLYQKVENIYFDRKIIHMYILLSLVGIGLLLTLTRQCFHTMLIIGTSPLIQAVDNNHIVGLHVMIRIHFCFLSANIRI